MEEHKGTGSFSSTQIIRKLESGSLNEQIADLMLEEYWRILQGMLLHLHFIEEALKAYLRVVHKVIRNCVQEVVPYKYDEGYVKGESLEQLISRFSMLNSNEVLIKKLEKIVEWRRYCLDKSFSVKVGQKPDLQQLKTEIKKISEADGESITCMLAVFDEIKKLQINAKRASVDLDGATFKLA